MNYSNITEGCFLSRPNRFIAEVGIAGKRETVHVKNTGRCRELLIPGAQVWLSGSDNPNRRTRFDLVAVKKETPRGALIINMDSQAPNEAAAEWLRKGEVFGEKAVIKREVTHGDSRFDLCIESGGKRSFLEVKGVTLEADGVAMFPDAPTERGLKHIAGLMRCVEEGLGAYILFVIQMKGIREFKPNRETHPEFAGMLSLAQKSGVNILAYDCIVTPSSMTIDKPVPVNLDQI